MMFLDRLQSSDNAPYIVAELACAHEGEFEFALGQIRAAADGKASGVKFQVFSADGLTVADEPAHQAYRRFEFTAGQWRALANEAHTRGLDVLIDAFEPWSLEIAEAVGAVALKVHSTNVTNPYYLRQVAACGAPVLLGTGGTTPPEIGESLEILRGNNVPVILVHGFQGYPTQPVDTDLRRIPALSRDFACPVGFAGHSDAGSDWPLWENLMALAIGCSLLEIHLTLDRSPARTDFHSSLLPGPFAELVCRLRQAAVALGAGDYAMGKAEEGYRLNFKSRIVSRGCLPKGHRLRLDDLAFKRAKRGLLPREAERILGKVLRKSVIADESITDDIIEEAGGVLS